MVSETRFRNQVALVVGAANGIGRAIAMRLGREGASVGVADVEADALEATLKEMQQEGSQARCVLCDVREPHQVEAAVTSALSWHGRIDILMYIAGVASTAP